jgi:hypothetical protein
MRWWGVHTPAVTLEAEVLEEVYQYRGWGSRPALNGTKRELHNNLPPVCKHRREVVFWIRCAVPLFGIR